MIIKNTDNGYGESKKPISLLSIKAVIYEQRVSNNRLINVVAATFLITITLPLMVVLVAILIIRVLPLQVVVVVVVESVVGDIAGEM